MREQEILNLLGLALRAGKIETGTEKVMASIRAKRYKLVILADDASDNSKEKIIRLAENNNVPLVVWGTSDVLADAIGKGITIAIGIKDAGFAKTIKKKFETEDMKTK